MENSIKHYLVKINRSPLNLYILPTSNICQTSHHLTKISSKSNSLVNFSYRWVFSIDIEEPLEAISIMVSNLSQKTFIQYCCLSICCYFFEVEIAFIFSLHNIFMLVFSLPPHAYHSSHHIVTTIITSTITKKVKSKSRDPSTDPVTTDCRISTGGQV